MNDIYKERFSACHKINDADIKIAAEISEQICKCKQICDIGFGNTLLAEMLVKINPDICYLGIDLNTTCVSEAQKKSLGSNISFFAGNMYEVSLPQIDCFVASRVVHHMPPDEVGVTICNIMSHIKECGKLVIVDSIRDYSNRPQHYLYLPFYFLTQTYRYLSSYATNYTCIGDAEVGKYWVLVLEVLKGRAEYSLKFID